MSITFDGQEWYSEDFVATLEAEVERLKAEKARKFVRDEPEEGTPALGVVFYILHQREIIEATGREPIGYVVEEQEQENDE